jgi:hypothetical protein
VFLVPETESHKLDNLFRRYGVSEESGEAKSSTVENASIETAF